MNAPRLILFNFDPARTALVAPCAAACGFDLRRAANREHRVPLSDIRGSTPADPLTQPAFREEMMVFEVPDHTLVFAFLDRLRESAVPAPALKAVLTPDNLHWTPEKLCAELKAEHAALSGKDRQIND